MHIEGVASLGWTMSAADCVRATDAAPVDRAVVMTLTDLPRLNPRGLEFVAEACADHPDRLLGFVRRNPAELDWSRDLLVRAVTELGFKGLKLHPVSTLQHPGVPPTIELVRLAGELGPDPVPLRRRAAQHPALCRPGRCRLPRHGDHPRAHGRLLPRRRGAGRGRAAPEPGARDLGHAVPGEDPGGGGPGPSGWSSAAAARSARRPSNGKRWRSRTWASRQRPPCWVATPPGCWGPDVTVEGLVFLGESHFGHRLEVADALAAMAAVGTDLAVAAPVHPHGADFRAANVEVTAAAGSTRTGSSRCAGWTRGRGRRRSRS